MKSFRKKNNLLLVIITSVIAQFIGLEMSAIAPAQGQSITPANTNDTNTTVILNNGTYTINGGQTSPSGTNLFHSFQIFNLNKGETANFNATANILNILGRVVGGDASIINGIIQVSGSNANLYLINPAGIVFGANASLNVNASFAATTATGINFSNGIFNAEGVNNYANLDGNPTGFNFANLQTGSILNLADLKLTNSNQTLSLIGGTVVSSGTISAPQGNIIIASIEGGKFLRISQPGNLLSLEIATPQTTSITPVTLAKLLTGSEPNLTDNNGQVSLTDSGININAGDVVAPSVIDAQNANLFAANKLIVNSPLSTNGNLNLQTQNNNDIIVNGDVITTGGNISLTGNVLLNSDAIFSSNDKDITFNSTVNGGKNLTLNAGTGNLTFRGCFKSGGLV